MKSSLILAALFSYQFAIAQTAAINIQVDANVGRKNISSYIYGKNGNVSDDPNNPTSNWQMMRDAGLRFTRENGGNNATKYNWRKKLGSHPDWYNNVYPHDWDFAAKSLQDNMPDVQGMWAFQLIGWAASNTNHNFDDWDFNGSNWWTGVEQNLAGGGSPNRAGGSAALVNGNPNLYLQHNWTADSTTDILKHWFGAGGLGYNQSNRIYWSMDNEPEIWFATHDDVVPIQIPAESFMQMYFAVAKAARAKFPNIKLTGPVPATEWQWYNWSNDPNQAKIVAANGQRYTWMEYFIKRCAEAQDSMGIKLVDVIDIHDYPGETNNADIVQGHRIFFDENYNYPGANGVRRTNPATDWDPSITKEYIFGRINKWLTQYMGANHGVTLGVSEYGLNTSNVNVTANSYASVMGTFADNNVEFFTPWNWIPGMWETLHLFSRYAKNIRVQSTSGLDSVVSAYSSVNTVGDSMTIILVNRDLSAARTVNLTLSNFNVLNGNYDTKQLSNLPSSETFKSETNNALKSGTITVGSNTLHISLPALSETAVILKGKNILSVSLLTFTAQAQANNSALLQWTTTTETNNKGFYVERSADSLNWTDLTFVNSQAAGGNSTVPNNYQFTDNSPLAGDNFYRLKQEDLSGTITYSTVQKLSFGTPAAALQVSPNPATGEVRVTLPAGAGSNVTYRLIGTNGSVILSGTMSNTNGYGKISVSNVATGMYFLQVITNNTVQNFKLQVMH
ncbi:MAG: T9SS type A sorting domain-containing protein [Chitinophagaceae bacterium]|jgi:hypothetical protein|nr:T9SS type A sorting domain-containing protein [Chitinophagaceae bacterium]